MSNSAGEDTEPTPDRTTLLMGFSLCFGMVAFTEATQLVASPWWSYAIISGVTFVAAYANFKLASRGGVAA